MRKSSSSCWPSRFIFSKKADQPNERANSSHSRRMIMRRGTKCCGCGWGTYFGPNESRSFKYGGGSSTTSPRNVCTCKRALRASITLVASCLFVRLHCLCHVAFLHVFCRLWSAFFVCPRMIDLAIGDWAWVPSLCLWTPTIRWTFVMLFNEAVLGLASPPPPRRGSFFLQRSSRCVGCS